MAAKWSVGHEVRTLTHPFSSQAVALLMSLWVNPVVGARLVFNNAIASLGHNFTSDTKAALGACRRFAALCTPYNGEDLQWHPVTTAMSKPDFQGPECCKPLKRQNIASFFKPKGAKGPAEAFLHF